MKNNIDIIAQKALADEQTRRAFDRLALRLDHNTRIYLEYIYYDPEVRSMYEGLRKEAELRPDSLRRKDSRRMVLKFPNKIVYDFLQDIMSEQYGEDWLTNKNKLSKILKNEELVSAWQVDTL